MKNFKHYNIEKKSHARNRKKQFTCDWKKFKNIFISFSHYSYYTILKQR